MPPEATLETIAGQVSKLADSIVETNKAVTAVTEKVEGNVRSFDEFKKSIAVRPDGTFGVMHDDAGKLDPQNAKHVREHFSVPRMLSAAYWDRCENRGDKAWDCVPGKNAASFERDVIFLARDEKTRLYASAEPGALSQMQAMRSAAVDPGPGKAGFRAQTTGVGSEGGFLVPNQLGWYDDILRNALVISQMGVKNIPASGIPFYFNKKSTASNGAYLTSETATLGTSQMAFSQVSLFPRGWGYYVPCSRRALKLAQPDLESLVRDDLMMASALNRQTQLLKGTGLTGAPIGIINAGSGVTSTSQATTSMVTLAAAVSTVEKANGIVNPNTVGWITSPGFKAVVGTLVGSVATGTAGAYATFADPGKPWMRTALVLHGYPMVSTAALSSTDTSAEGIHGDWSMAAMIDWGQEIIFSEHVLWTAQQVVIGIIDEHEVALRRTQSFTYWNNGEAI